MPDCATRQNQYPICMTDESENGARFLQSFYGTAWFLARVSLALAAITRISRPFTDRKSKNELLPIHPIRRMFCLPVPYSTLYSIYLIYNPVYSQISCTHIDTDVVACRPTLLYHMNFAHTAF